MWWLVWLLLRFLLLMHLLDLLLHKVSITFISSSVGMLVYMFEMYSEAIFNFETKVSLTSFTMITNIHSQSTWAASHSSNIQKFSSISPDPYRTVLQIWRSVFRFWMVSMEFFIDIILLIALWPWSRLSLWQKWVPGLFPGGKSSRCVRLATLPPSWAIVT